MRFSLNITQYACLPLCVLISACSSLGKFELDSSSKEAQEFIRRGDISEEVRSIAQPLVDQGHLTGVVVGVYLPDGSQQYFSYGSSGDANSKLNADTLFAGGSLSKGFVAALTASLVDEGILAWDDTLERLLPEARAFSADARKITLLQLATHNSGLPRQPFDFEMFSNLLLYTWNGQNIYPHINQAYVFDYLADFTLPKRIEPQYSNIGYGLIGQVIEQRTQQSFETLLQARILAPLNLQHTSYDLSKLPADAPRAQGHAGDQPKFMQRGSPVPDWVFTRFLKSSAGIYSSPRDLLTFASAHIACKPTRLNQILADNLKPRMERPLEAPAIQWVVDRYDGQKITYQIGMVAGYSGYIGLDAERRIAVVVLQNTFNWTDRVGHKLLRRLAAYADAKQIGIRSAQCHASQQALN